MLLPGILSPVYELVDIFESFLIADGPRAASVSLHSAVKCAAVIQGAGGIRMLMKCSAPSGK